MELRHIIEKLYRERQKLDDILASLEQVQAAQAAREQRVKKRRGRTSMDAEERKEVSRRMRDYWARRRVQRLGTDS